MVVGRPTVLKSGGRARVAAASPASADLAALLGLHLLGAKMEPVFGLAWPDVGAQRFLARGCRRGAAARARRARAVCRALGCGCAAAVHIWRARRSRQCQRAIRPIPTVPNFAELYAARIGNNPSGPLCNAWSAAAAAAQLEFGLVLPQLTPAAMVALWRRAGADAVASLGVQATAATVDVRPLGGPAATANTAALAASAPALQELRALARRPVQLASGLTRRRSRMKLWYQSMSRQTEWGGYPRVLRGILDKVRDPDTEIHVAGITEIGGVGDQFRYLEYLETGEVLKNVHRAVREGFDAFLIGNIADPGLREAREIADIPVLGLCESALHVACMMGASFSLVTINEKFTPRIVENVRSLRAARSACGGEPHADRAADRSRRRLRAAARRGIEIVAQFNRAARANAEAGAEVVIAAGGVVMALLAHAGIHADRGRHADPERHHQPGEAGRDGGED